MKSAIIVGAGISGLSCALHLKNAGWKVSVVEKSDAPGGRVRTDKVNGFLLDRGFQVLSDAYPEARRILDMEALCLQAFGSGARVFQGSGLHLFADPFSHPAQALPSVLSPVGSLADKLRLLRMKREICSRTLEEIWAGPDTTSMAYLRRRGFSEAMIQHFLGPFFRGVFLENDLATSSRMLEFTFSMFARGRATLPAAGMQAIPDQLADRIGREVFQLNSRVTRVTASGIAFKNGERRTADAVVWAAPDQESPSDWQATTTFYYNAPAAPFTGPWLALNGSGKGRINQIVVPSNVAPGYAPKGRSLVSVCVNGVAGISDVLLEKEVRGECGAWFGEQVRPWRLLGTYTLPKALPSQPAGRLPFRKAVVDERGVFRAGDDCTHASLQGAMESGRRAAEAVLAS